ncbi:hypothetical protein pb186bvf_014134 [Paramecium bursaria]
MQQNMNQEKQQTISIVVIGASGQGKSSLINIILNEDKAMAGNDLDGVTKNISEYETQLDQNNLKLILYDLPGFGDADISVDQLAEQWNKVLSNKKIDLIFFCHQISNARMDLITRVSLNVVTNSLKNPMIEKTFVVAITQVDRSDKKELAEFKQDFVQTQLIPKLKGLLGASEINQIIYTSNKQQQETRLQVEQTCMRYLNENKMFRIGLLGETLQGQIQFINAFQEYQIINKGQIQLLEAFITTYQIQGMQIEFVLINYQKDMTQEQLLKQWRDMYGSKKLNMLITFMKQNDENTDVLTEIQFSKYQQILENKLLNQSYSIVINSIDTAEDLKTNQKKICQSFKKMKIAISDQNLITLSDGKNIKQNLERCVNKYEDARKDFKETRVASIEKKTIKEAQYKVQKSTGKPCISLNSKILSIEGYAEISKLKEGQIILVRKDQVIQTDEIICFIHRNFREFTRFIKIIFQNNDFITLTPNHLIKLHLQTFIQAQYIKKGDMIERVDGKEVYPDQVIEVQQLYEQGYICPLSISGQLIISDCVVSCYSNCSQRVGDIFTWPIRKLSVIRYLFKQKENSEEIHPYFKLLLGLNKHLKFVKDEK